MKRKKRDREEQCDGVRTDEELAEILGVTRSRVQQLRKVAVRKLWRYGVALQQQILMESGGNRFFPLSGKPKP
jgi:DNA-directed RNA polymerase sigma subunit (sigma70/sigma32)